MSIGFLGANSNQKTIDVFGGNAGTQIDLSLQNVLTRYDSIRTDFDRLSDSASQKTYDLVSKQIYNSYLKESSSGWAETWYSEYRAVLSLRADALQKKLQAAYNRVLEKSTYAEIEANKESVFAPYANRTFSGEDVNYRMPLPQVFIEDRDPGQAATTIIATVAPTTPPVLNTTPWTQRIHDGIVSKWFTPEAGSIFGDYDGDGRSWGSTADTTSTPHGALSKVHYDPREILGIGAWASEKANALTYNNVMSPPLTEYAPTTTNYGGPIYRIDTGSAINARSYYFSPLAITIAATDTTTGNGIYGNGATVTTNYLTTAQYNLLRDTAGPYTTLKTNFGSRTTRGALNVTTGTVHNGVDFVNSLTSNVHAYDSGWNIAGGSDVFWVPDATKSYDVTGDGLSESLAGLLNGNNYGIFTSSTYPDAGSSAVSPYGHVDPSKPAYSTIDNTYLWDGDAAVSPKDETLLDSRAESFHSLSRLAQIDAAIKATYDAINSKSVTQASVIDVMVSQALSVVDQTMSGIPNSNSRDSVLAFGNGTGPIPPYALQLNGVNQYVQVPDSPSLDIVGSSYTSTTPQTITVSDTNDPSLFPRTYSCTTLQNLTAADTNNGGASFTSPPLPADFMKITQAQYNSLVAGPKKTAFTLDTNLGNFTSLTTAQYNSITNATIKGNFALGGNEMTMEAWIKTSDPGSYSEIINKENSYELAIINGHLTMAVETGSDGNNWWWTDPIAGYTGGNISDGQWHHVAGVKDATGMHLYVDGVNVQNASSGPGSDPKLDITPSNEVLSIGRRPGGAYFNGLIDEVRISKVARYTAGFTRPSSEFTTDFNTVALYHFNQEYATTGTPPATNNIVKDYGMTNDGTRMGGAVLNTSDWPPIVPPFNPATDSHPWGGINPDDPYYMGMSYTKVGYSSGDWKDENGLYTGVRSSLETIADQLMNPTTVPPADVSTSDSPSNADYAGSYSSDVTIGRPKLSIPEFGMGDVSLDFTNLPREVYDTLLSNPGSVGAIQQGLDYIKEAFYGRQYDEILLGNKYDASYTHMTMSVLPGGHPVWTGVDAVAMSSYGGNLIQAGGVAVTPENPYVSIRTLPGIYYGHTSAITSNVKPTGNAVVDAVLTTVGGMPTLGLFGMMITIPIPYFPMTIATNVSYDFYSMLMNTFMQQVKKPIVEAMQVQSYAASSGSAFDSYASRAEYHFSEPGLSEALKQFGKIEIIPPNAVIPDGLSLDFGSFFESILFGDGLSIGGMKIFDGVLAPDELFGAINDATAKERIFEYKHTVQGAESRETETGAFFATSAFLSQFELNNLGSEYWIGTQQNEELVNTDLLRTVMTAGKELMKMIAEAMLAYLASQAASNPWLGLAFSVAKPCILMPMIEASASQVMFNLLYRDQEMTTQMGKALTLGGSLITGRFTTEGFDYIESDHKPFEADSDFNYPPTPSNFVGKAGQFLAELFNQGTPDFVLDGYANTRRFQRKQASSTLAYDLVDGNDYTSVYSFSASETNSAGQTYGVGPRPFAGTKDAPTASGGDDGQTGWWTDTTLGDINEVYVATRKVSFSNLSVGFNSFTDGSIGSEATNYGTQTVSAEARRYIGSDSRTFGRRYDPSEPVNQETFNAGVYSSVYDSGGSKIHYDRRNQYALSFSPTADGNVFSLYGSQALNPSIGGFIKMSQVDKNKTDGQLLAYDSGGISAVVGMAKNANDQQFGAATDGTLNELNRVLYEHMHLRADSGIRNLSLVKEYRDVFNTGLMKNIFISGSSYHPSGGGITSSIEIRFDSRYGNGALQSNTRESYDATSFSYDPYNTLFLTRSKGRATVYLNTYFAYKKRAGNKKT